MDPTLRVIEKLAAMGVSSEGIPGQPIAPVAAIVVPPTLSPRPWRLIFDRNPGRRFDGSRVEGVIDPTSLRIVDAESRLLVRIGADPEQALKGEDMQLIVEAINAL